MRKKANTNSEQEVIFNQGVNSEAVNIFEQDLTEFKLSVSRLDFDTLSSYQTILNQELARRRDQELDKVMQFFKNLSFDEQKKFLNSVQLSVPSKKRLTAQSEEKKKKEKNPLRMYQNFPNDEHPEYKVAPLVNLDLKEVFTGGNPNNKPWLANLSSKERYENYGTIGKLEQDPAFLDTLMEIPRAVFKQQEGDWVDCCEL
ncbi:MAG: hypothetical protein KDJ31_04615 [Candidatus Competibacteraceae bacterium]|nr:hypothetical protein [Candidatus Competibacteraceae bacterium]